MFWLFIRLTPAARLEAINGVYQDKHSATYLQVSVRAFPEKGKANAALVALISKELRIPKNSTMRLRGQTSRLKLLELPFSNMLEAQLLSLAAQFPAR